MAILSFAARAAELGEVTAAFGEDLPSGDTDLVTAEKESRRRSRHIYR